ncbi:MULTISPECIES: hypothetical protein [unclassified Streptomyces]|uniref:hypothetical protein n=1 Tax=unclassified Streptomyces TaxID=2593676 RepID=UPI0033D50439
MAELISAPIVLAVSAQAEKTERSPLLYAWWALQLVVLAAVVYGLCRLAKKWRDGRRTRG